MSSAAIERRLSGEELRLAFDASFAAPPRATQVELEDLLLIRVCGQGYALRSRELSGIFSLKKLTPLPCSTPELLGLVSVRGVLVPVFGLSHLLGYEPSTEPLRWLSLVGTDEPIALAFHAITDFKKVPLSALSVAADAAGSDAGGRITVSFEDQVRVVLGVPALVASIRQRVGRARPKKEA